MSFLLPLNSAAGVRIGVLQVLQLAAIIEDEVRATRRSIAIVTVLMILAGTMTVYLISRIRFSKPTEELLRSFREVAAGDLSARVPVRSRDEWGRLAAGLAHEIGTPLNVISGRVESLQARPGNDAIVGRNMEIILSQTDRITRTMHNMLDFARAREPNLAPLDIGVILRSVLEFLESRLERRGIHAYAQPPPRTPLHGHQLRCDSRAPAGERTIRTSQGRLHRCSGGSCGIVPGGGGGSVFLDEIGDMPTALQAKLLRVLQEKEGHPIGASAPVPVDIRIVAATHHDLSAMITAGRFREDLLYRLNVITIRIPPLRERGDDLVPLLAQLLEKHGRRLGRTDCTVAPEALAVMQRYAWPGNVRELENVVERALVLGNDNPIGIDDLPDTLVKRKVAAPSALPFQAMADVERHHILKMLRLVGGNKAQAARLLGLDRKTLYRKLQAYGEEGPEVPQV